MMAVPCPGWEWTPESTMVGGDTSYYDNRPTTGSTLWIPHVLVGFGSSGISFANPDRRTVTSGPGKWPWELELSAPAYARRTFSGFVSRCPTAWRRPAFVRASATSRRRRLRAHKMRRARLASLTC